MTFTVTRTGDLNSAFTVNYATADGTAIAGTDYTATSGTLSFASAQTAATISVPVIGNTTAQPNRTFSVQLSNASVPVEFRSAQNFAVGGTPDSVMVGDFNADGRPDLVVANSSGNTVSILLGNGNGTFKSAVNYNVGGTPAFVVVADFNGDAKSDLAVANSSGNTVTVLLGNGNGTFQSAVNYTVGSGPVSLAAGDFSGDGKPDLAVADSSGNAVSILVGNGNGTFAAAVNYSVSGTANSVTARDLNADGKLDLAVADTSTNSLGILLGNGNGTFKSVTTSVLGTAPSFVTGGDFNGDGKLDLAIANSSGNSVSILLGNGNGAFKSPVNYTVGAGPQSITVGDFNGDGIVDLATANSTANAVSVLLGNATGTFKAAANYSVGTTPQSVAQGDFDSDGRADVVTANSANTFSVVLDNALSVALDTASALGTILDDDSSVTLAAFSGNDQSASTSAAFGKDLIVSAINAAGNLIPNSPVTFTAPSSGARGTFAGGVTSVTVNANALGFATAPAFTAGTIVGTYTVTASNGTSTANFTLANGQPVVTNVSMSMTEGSFSFLPSGFDGGFTDSTGTPLQSVQIKSLPAHGTLTLGGLSVTLNQVIARSAISTLVYTSTSGYGGADSFSWNANDGVSYAASPALISLTISTLPHLSIANSSIAEGDSGTSNMVFTVTRSGDLTLAFTVNYATVDGTAIAGTDYTATSGTLTFASGQTTATISVPVFGNTIYQSNRAFSIQLSSASGSAEFPSQQNYTVDGAASSIAGGDFNGDGRMDLATANTNVRNAVSVLLGNADGTFQSAMNSSVSNPRSVTAGDFNGDGKLDLATANNTSSTMSILLGNGNGTFQSAVNQTLGGTPAFIMAADFNADGIVDLAVGNASTLSVLLGNGNGTFKAATNYTMGGTVWSVSVGDFNGDGKVDLAVTNGSAVEILLGKGNGTFLATVNYTVGASPLYVTVGDFNGDGNADVVAANFNSGTVSVLLGNGNGTFQSAVNYTVGTDPRFVTAVDLNGDGKLDLAVANSYISNATLSVLVGNGDGTFQAATTYAVGGVPYAIAVSDFNGDGKTDLAVADEGLGRVNLLLQSSTSVLMDASSATGTIQDNDSPATITVLAGNGQTTDYSTTFGTTLAVTIRNASGDLVQNAPVTFTAPTSGAGGTFLGGFSTFAVNTNGSGVATASVFTANAAIGAYIVTASSAAAPSANFTLTNVLPLLSSVNQSLNEDGTFSFLASSFDASFGSVGGPSIQNIKVTSLPAHGTLALNGSAVSMNQVIARGAISTIIYTPVTGYTGTDSFGWNGTNVATFAAIPATVNLTISPLPHVSIAGSTLVEGDSGTLNMVFTVTRSGDMNSAFTVNYATANGTAVAGTDYTAVSGTLTFASGQTTATISVPIIGNTIYQSNRIFSVQLSSASVPAKFSAQPNYTAGSGPYEPAVGDFNGDGNLDLAIVNASSASVSVFLGNGNGTFKAATNYSVGSLSAALAVGDFNRDGNLDLATVGNTLCILLGNGNGTFRSAVNYASISNSIAVGDFNQDGKMDLAVSSSNSVGIWLGNGDGTFQASINDSIASVTSIAVGDFNLDGKLDLAVTINSSSNMTSVLLGNGNGTFHAAVNIAVGSSPSSVSVGDFNGDGNPDLAVAIYGSNVVTAILGNGNGTFQAPVNYATYEGRSATVADFNGDGKLDIIAPYSSILDVSVLFGNGNGTFQPTVIVPSNGYGWSVMAGDFNGDHRPDLVTANLSGSNVSVLLNNAPAVILDTTSATGTIQDNDSAATISLTGSGSGQSTDILQPFAKLLSVDIWNSSGDLVQNAPVVFTGPSSGASCTFAGGFASITVNTNSSGTATTSVITANGTSGAYLVTASSGAAPTARLSLTNTDPVQLSAAIYSGIQGGTASFTVTRVGTTAGETVSYATSNSTAIAGTDYTAASGTITFTAGQTSKTISISLTDRNVVAADKTFTVKLTAGTNTVLGAIDTATVTVINKNVTNKVKTSIASTHVFGTTNYSQKITINNISAYTLTGTISLVLDGLASGITLLTAGAQVAPDNGSYYYNFAIGSGGLAAGQSVTLTLLFKTTNNVNPTYTPRIIAGTGTR